MLLRLLLIAAAVASSESGSARDETPTIDNEFIFNRYPPRALAAGEQGRVKFRVDIDKEGNVTACTVLASSGFERLDRETCDLMVEHAKFYPVLDAMGKAQSAAHLGFVNWRIPGVALTSTIAATGQRPMEKVVCKRVQKTGSLVSNSRTCMTKREWSQQADQYQEDWGAIQGRQGSSRSP
ncbi:energy transducer TonB [Sphingomonas sp. NSE70-1]|uniref:Energy transducer TonB n=1 Tax=Sphingomonas caseinilyticus TaxID=2908205 RepID=A0ABT0RRF5_9SPHN|nr:energy transducer TonB [Sphingomonas caseinilyticus]MCL6697599.1 energy transducer TonB [Sphingomonas caseinilyticus]